jgi:hypothetical protein
MRHLPLAAAICLSLFSCASDHHPSPKPVADSNNGLYCWVRSTGGCGGCATSCIPGERASCIPGTDGAPSAMGMPPTCGVSAQCLCVAQ